MAAKELMDIKIKLELSELGFSESQINMFVEEDMLYTVHFIATNAGD